MLQAKTQDEMKAYQDATAITDAAQLLAAADAFAVKYPASELRAALYIRALNMYAQQNNVDKLIEVGRKAIAADPINPVPLVQVASALAESTRDTDLDRETRINEAAKDAQAALDNLDTGLIVPPNAPAERIAGAKRNIATMSYDTLGMVAMGKKDYAAAEQNFLKAVDASNAAPEAVVYLRLSVAQDQQKKYPQALESANKAAQYAPEGSPAQNLAKQQQVRLQKLIAAGSSSGGTAAAPAATTPSGTPATAPPTPTPPATPPK
jgi:tetratricopeptide (TPR) repeat protein